MKKMLVLLVLLLIPIVWSATGAISNFDEQTNPFDLHFLGTSSLYNNITLPRYVNVDSVNIIFENNGTVVSNNITAYFSFDINGTDDTNKNKPMFRGVNTDIADFDYIRPGMVSNALNISLDIFEEPFLNRFNIQIDNSRTIAFWLYCNNVSYAQDIFGDANPGVDQGFDVLIGGDRLFRIEIFDFPPGTILKNVVPLENNTWYHTTILLNSSGNALLYLNASLVNEIAYDDDAAKLNIFNSGLSIGEAGRGALRFARSGCMIDELYFYNYPFMQEQINALFENGRQNPNQFFPSLNFKVGDNNINTTGNYNITNATLFNDALANGCVCSGCKLTATECTVPLLMQDVGNISVNLFNLSYSFGLDNCSDYAYPILNTSYYDADTNSPITVENGFDLTVESPFFQTLQGTFSGDTSNVLCSAINNTAQGFNYSITGQFTLSKDEYATQIYEYTLGNPLVGSNTPLSLENLYLIRLNESSTVVFTWLTTSYKAIDGTMEIYRCEGDGTRTLIDSTPVINGDANANLVLITQPYSYEIITGGERFTDDSDFTKCHIETQTERQFLVNTEGIDVQPVTGMYSIECNLTSTGNDTVKIEWGTNPDNDDEIEGCLFAYRMAVTGTTLVDTACSTTSPIERTIPLSGFNYNVQGKLFQSGYSIPCKDNVEFGYPGGPAKSFGLAGILSVVFLLAGMLLIFSNEQPSWYPLATGIALIGAWVLGIIAFGWIPISSLVAFLIIIMIIGRYNKQAT